MFKIVEYLRFFLKYSEGNYLYSIYSFLQCGYDQLEVLVNE